MGKTRWMVGDGPLEGEIFALDEGCPDVDITFTLADGRVAVYGTRDNSQLTFLGIDPFA